MVLVTMCELDGDVSRAVLLRPQVELQVPRLPPDFLSGLVVSVDFMRLSSKKAAYVVVDESRVVGNPEFARDDKVEDGDFCLKLLSGWMPAGPIILPSP